MTPHIKQPPKAVGLYDPRFEHDACGVGMVARLDNLPTHEVISRAITALENLEHRGASGADPCTGDGAGILMQMPDELLRATVDFELPPAGALRRADVLPADRRRRARRACRRCSSAPCARRASAARLARRAGRRRHTGEVAGACRPVIRQLFVGAGAAQGDFDQDAFERKLYVIRRVCELRRRERRASTSPRAPRARSTTRAC